ncbi:MAG: T9SS type A sorting domain-containing protein, partial [candidate division Zixibacteria bacterium]|nr:T9SS type A sorting domain-containing protein [candidate division Zixibacteria bacterium]
MKKYFLTVIILLIMSSTFVLSNIRESESIKNYLTNNIKNIVQNVESDESQNVTIYYGLNDSHSRSWAKENNNGETGIIYFQRFENSENEGTLLYKTIHSDGLESIDSLTTGTRLEKSVLLFDELSRPHIFVAQSNNSDQIIDHYFKNGNGQWQNETIIHFLNEGGKFIYELSADTGPDHSFHLIVLKTRSDIDSDDFNWAWLDSNLYHVTNASGSWQRELIKNYNMAYTYDMYIKSTSRQDIKVDKNGYAHITFSEQNTDDDGPSRLWYVTNKTGDWVFEIALNHENTRDDAGWFPSLCLDNNDIPYISCMYIKRVLTFSAQYCKLLLLKRLAENNWQRTVIADHDDGYHGGDGRQYTGGLSHLVFDNDNTPHIIFSDIASTHWPHPENQLLNMGNIRYGFLENDTWNITTIYRQPLPTRFYIATEMHGMCLIVSEITNTVRIIGQEMVITGDNQYSSNLLNFTFEENNVNTDSTVFSFELNQNYPNPFNSSTKIRYKLLQPADVVISIYNILGQKVKVLENRLHNSGPHTAQWNGKDESGDLLASGIYFCRINA